MDEMVKYLKALVYMQAQMLEATSSTAKAEVLLAYAGLPYKEIAEVLGKSQMAIAKTVSRAKATAKGKSND